MKMSDGIGEAGDFVDLVQRGFYDGPGALVYWGAVGPMGAFWVLRVGENQFHPFWLIVADLLFDKLCICKLIYIIVLYCTRICYDAWCWPSLSHKPSQLRMPIQRADGFIIQLASLASSGCA